ncbi:MAG: hypothetical protein GY743_22070 [Planctomycetaceae bacterium]|nr:hypothetical protein [Planctomycetaceae bacterium]
MNDGLDLDDGYFDVSLLHISPELDPSAQPMGMLAFVNPADAIGLSASTAGFSLVPGYTRVLYTLSGTIASWNSELQLLAASMTLDTSGGYSGGPVWTAEYANGQAKVFALVQSGYVGGADFRPVW